MREGYIHEYQYSLPKLIRHLSCHLRVIVRVSVGVRHPNLIHHKSDRVYEKECIATDVKIAPISNDIGHPHIPKEPRRSADSQLNMCET